MSRTGHYLRSLTVHWRSDNWYDPKLRYLCHGRAMVTVLTRSCSRQSFPVCRARLQDIPAERQRDTENRRSLWALYRLSVMHARTRGSRLAQMHLLQPNLQRQFDRLRAEVSDTGAPLAGFANVAWPPAASRRTLLLHARHACAPLARRRASRMA